MTTGAHENYQNFLEQIYEICSSLVTIYESLANINIILYLFHPHNRGIADALKSMTNQGREGGNSTFYMTVVT